MNIFVLTFFTTIAVDYRECIYELKSSFGDKAPSYCTVINWFNEFNWGRRSLTDEVRECRPKIDNIELIMQDRHVTYREIEISLGFSSTSIHSMMHEHLAVNKICSHWIPRNLTIPLKKVRVSWCKEMLQNTIAVLQKTYIRSNHRSMRMSPKQNNSPLCG